MTADEYLRAGRLEECLACLQESVRTQPGDARLRAFLFQLFCVLGQWDRALNQLEVMAGLKGETLLAARVYQAVIQCEIQRAEVFTGKRTPVIFGEPAEWMSWLVQANQLVAKSQFEAAAKLRDEAFDAAPPTRAKVGETEAAWIADADPRLGPIVEVILGETYYWIPFCRIKAIRMNSPKNLRDLVWAPASFIWSNYGEASGFIPVRYPGTESSPDGSLRLARKTKWLEKCAGYSLGFGQRLWASDQNDFPLLEVRHVETSPGSC